MATTYPAPDDPHGVIGRDDADPRDLVPAAAVNVDPSAATALPPDTPIVAETVTAPDPVEVTERDPEVVSIESVIKPNRRLRPLPVATDAKAPAVSTAIMTRSQRKR